MPADSLEGPHVQVAGDPVQKVEQLEVPRTLAQRQQLSIVDDGANRAQALQLLGDARGVAAAASLAATWVVHPQDPLPHHAR